MNISAPIDTAERVEAAARLMSAGHAGEAETVLKDVLAREPGHPDALNALASLALARSDPHRALAVLGPACTAFPDHPRLLANLGLAHFMLGRPQDAVLCLERAVARAPHEPKMRLSLAQYLAAAGNWDRSLGEIERVLREAPDDAAALAQFGTTAMAMGDLARAETALREAAAADPDNADVLANLSVLCGLAGRHEEAAVLAERAHLRAPFDMTKQMQFAGSSAVLGDFDRAADLCKRILVTAPDNLAATQLFGRIAIARGAVESGISTLSQVVRRQPRSADAILTLAGALRFAGRMTQALTFVDQALALSPDHPHGRNLRTDLLLTLGRFSEVWTEVQDQTVERPGIVIAPKATTLIDAVLFGRFIADLRAEGVALDSKAEPSITDLLNHVQGIVADRVGTPGAPAILLQGLPAFLKVGLDGIRAKRRYLSPKPDQAERWQKAFALLPRPLIGVAWDQFRPGLPMREMAPLVDEVGTPVSLATGPERHQLREWPKAIDAGLHIRTSADLIAAVSCLDAVVATEGALLHVAGAQGLPGIAIASAGYSWPMAPEGDRLAWHPSLRRLGQTSPGQWGDVLSALPERLSVALQDQMEDLR